MKRGWLNSARFSDLQVGIVMFHPSDWDFAGKPKWKPINKAEPKIPRWIRVFSEKKPGEHVTVYEREPFNQIRDWCVVNHIPHEVVRFRGGGWRITRR